MTVKQMAVEGTSAVCALGTVQPDITLCKCFHQGGKKKKEKKKI